MSELRVDYEGDGLRAEDLRATPYEQASDWLEAALARQQELGDVPEPASMSLATVDSLGRPNVRTVLMRFFSGRGPGFVCSLTSAKGQELTDNPVAAVSLTWPSMYRAIRMRGSVEQIERSAIVAYFNSRPWGSRISSWASEQSEVIESREALEARYEEFARRWPDHGHPSDVPVPTTWGGFRIVPDEVEFWAGRRSRLHDRLVFTKTGDGDLADAGSWTVSRRQP